MKDYIKYVILGCAVGAGVWGVVKGAEYVYEHYVKEVEENPEYDQIMDDLKDEMRPIWEGETEAK